MCIFAKIYEDLLKMKIYQNILSSKAKEKKLLCILIDPDKSSVRTVEKIAVMAEDAGVDYFFIGGSLITNDTMKKCISVMKETSAIPVIIFPGNTMQINPDADAILFLSLISGRNAEMLIGKHVIAAPYLRRTSLEIIPTGYILVDSGHPTAASYMSNTLPIPYYKDDIAVCTAMAGEMLGLKMIYIDAGSGAGKPVSISMIEQVKKNISVPLIIGGGIDSPVKAKKIYQAGADMIVVGNAVEKDPALIPQLAHARNI